MISPARAAAFDILLRVERERAYAGELLHSARFANLSQADHALCTRLVLGVLRWRSWLDSALGALSSTPLARLDIEVLTALRLAAFQLGFLDRIPARAAVNESAELVKRARKRSATGLVNAVLRKLAAAPGLLQPGTEPQTEPKTESKTESKTKSNSKTKTASGLAESYAHPLWLVERWADTFGLETAERICAFNQKTPQTTIRLLDPAAEAELENEGITLSPGWLLHHARRVVSGDITRSRAFAAPRIAIQDEASQLVAELVGQGESLLDCCAAPGNKTRILRERNPRALIVATELHPHRARLMHKRIEQAQPAGEPVRVVIADATALPLRAQFERVLADVPCSGTGTLARHPEIKWRLTAEDLRDLRQKQVAILSAALERLQPGGRLVYSTCSLEPEENAEVVNHVLSASEQFRLCYCRLELERLRRSGELVLDDLEEILDGPFLRTLPGRHPGDGFFAAVLERR